jgi:hypothetical protein
MSTLLWIITGAALWLLLAAISIACWHAIITRNNHNDP